MEEKNKLSEDNLKINEQGNIEHHITFDLSEVNKHCKNAGMFLQGFFDGINSTEFNESDEDYIRGFRYSKTGIFDSDC